MDIVKLVVRNTVLFLVSHREMNADHGFALVAAGQIIFGTETSFTS